MSQTRKLPRITISVTDNSANLDYPGLLIIFSFVRSSESHTLPWDYHCKSNGTYIQADLRACDFPWITCRATLKWHGDALRAILSWTMWRHTKRIRFTCRAIYNHQFAQDRYVNPPRDSWKRKRASLTSEVRSQTIYVSRERRKVTLVKRDWCVCGDTLLNSDGRDVERILERREVGQGRFRVIVWKAEQDVSRANGRVMIMAMRALWPSTSLFIDPWFFGPWSTRETVENLKRFT